MDEDEFDSFDDGLPTFASLDDVNNAGNIDPQSRIRANYASYTTVGQQGTVLPHHFRILISLVFIFYFSIA